MVKEAKPAISMNCPTCRTRCQRYGKHRNGLRRFRCMTCNKNFTEPHTLTLGEMFLSPEKMLMIVQLLVEGNSIRSAQRITGVDQNTIMKVLRLAGEKCERIMGRYVRDIAVKDVECDEVWSFLGKKEKRVRPDEDQNLGDCYTFVAIERNTKLVLNIAMGKRDQLTTNSFIEGVRDAIKPGTSFQMTTDGFAPYKTSIPDTFGDYVDYAMLIKVYRNPSEGEARYSPPEVAGVEVVPVCGNPDPRRICTSIIERSNLSLRMGQRRWTRLTNAFGRKWENQWAAAMLWYTYYNFCRVHKSLRVTPAMEAKITDHIWELSELLA
jgi:transposase-like protein/IS1 family transposase